jgi:TPR repeat protein
LLNKSLACHYFKLSADQDNAGGQFAYGYMLSLLRNCAIALS